jgi:hypothetical protein
VNNALMHQKVLTIMVQKLTPILTKIVEQGIKEGAFDTPYPQESIEILLAAVQTIFDDAYFSWSDEEFAQKIPAFICVMERTLGATTGSLAVFAELL